MITPYDSGFAIGSAVTGAVVGVTQSLAQAVDFGQLLSGHQEAEVQPQDNRSAEFVGLNDQHRDLAQHRVQLADAMSELESWLRQLQIDVDSITVAQDAGGQWKVQGPAEIRAELEAAMEHSPEWQAAWDQVLEELQHLQSQDNRAEARPGSIRSVGSSWTDAGPLTVDDMQMVYSNQRLSLDLI
jgi:hypothetical protein